MELPNTHAHTYGIHTLTHTHKKVERLEKKAKKVGRTKTKRGGVKKERKKKIIKDFHCARTLDCCALPAAACKSWPAEPHLMPQPPVVAKSCSNPRAHKAEVHYQRGTLVESRPCWQVVPFPRQSPAFPSTSPDEHHPNPEPFRQSSLFQFPQFPQHIHLCET